MSCVVCIHVFIDSFGTFHCTPDTNLALERIKEDFNYRSKQVRPQLRRISQYLIDRSKLAVVQGVRGLLRASSNPHETAKSIATSLKQTYVKLTTPSKTPEEEEMERLLKLIDEEEKPKEVVVEEKKVEVRWKYS